MKKRFSLLIVLLALTLLLMVGCSLGSESQGQSTGAAPTTTPVSAQAAPTDVVEPTSTPELSGEVAPSGPATVSIVTVPKGATVRVDGLLLRKTPTRVRLAPGTRRFVVHAQGYKPLVANVNLQPGSSPSLSYELKPLPALLKIRGVSRNSRIFLNGKQVGMGPLAMRVSAARHVIMVQRPGFKFYRQAVQFKPAQQRVLRVTLAPKPAAITVVSSPKGAKIFVDRKYRGVTPRTIAGLEPGKHRIGVYNPKYRRVVRQVRVAPGGKVTVRANLELRSAQLVIRSRPSGAEVYIDHKLMGTTPEVLSNIKPGRHRVGLYKAGYEKKIRYVRFKPGAKKTLNLRMVKASRSTGSKPSVPRRPLAVMVENHPDARPQSGLDYADVVLEAPAEYGVSRFIAVFITRDAPAIGPVRSARKYFVYWAKEFNSIYFHAGGSPGAAAVADEIELTRQNALWDGRGFYRTTDRVAPHNLYTNTQDLLQVHRAMGRNLKNGTWGGLRFKQPGTNLGPRKVSYARLAFNDYYYAEWRWDPARGVYRRWMQGEPAIERNTGAQVTATAVIVRFHQVSRIAGDDKAREEVQVFGSGKAFVLQDGRLTPATWRKRNLKSPTLYYDSQGRQIAVNKGGVWIQVLPQYGSASFR